MLKFIVLVAVIYGVVLDANKIYNGQRIPGGIAKKDPKLGLPYAKFAVTKKFTKSSNCRYTNSNIRMTSYSEQVVAGML